MKQRNLAAKIALVVALIGSLFLPCHAAMPVIDASNLAQNVKTAIQSVAQTKKQIEQYKTQLKQYENMIQNTLQPKATIWAQAQSTISKLVEAVNTLNDYKKELGSLKAYMEKFQDVAHYESFLSADSSNDNYRKIAENRKLASTSQKKANDALVKVLDQQQTTLIRDAETLQRLQSSAQGAKGQLQAIGTANQLASQQVYQLLQIRGLLVAQQNTMATYMQAQNDRAALEVASSEQFLKKRYRPSPPRSW